MKRKLQIISFSNLVILLSGTWLIAAPFILSYFQLEGPRINDIYVGIAISLLALSGLFKIWDSITSLSWIFGLIGLWLVSAPFVLDYSAKSLPTINSVITGLVVVSASLWQILSIPEESEIITRHFKSSGFGPSLASEIKNPKQKRRAKKSK